MLIGSVHTDPKLISVKTKNKAAQFSNEVVEFSKNELGEKNQYSRWFNMIAWDKKAEQIFETVKKGDMIFVEGRLMISEYTDILRNKRAKVDIVISHYIMLTKKGQEKL